MPNSTAISNPLPEASLLWAKRLTTHNAALLKRMDSLEAQSNTREERLSKADKAAEVYKGVIRDVEILKEMFRDLEGSLETRARSEDFSVMMKNHAQIISTVESKIQSLFADTRALRTEVNTLHMRSDTHEIELREVQKHFDETRETRSKAPACSPIEDVVQRLVALEAHNKEWQRLSINCKDLEAHVHRLEESSEYQKFRIMYLEEELSRFGPEKEPGIESDRTSLRTVIDTHRDDDIGHR
jgi:chaperonin cofactor prefoldin